MWLLINLLRVYRGCGAGAGNEQIFFAGAGRVRVMINILRVPAGTRKISMRVRADYCGCGAGAGNETVPVLFFNIHVPVSE